MLLHDLILPRAQTHASRPALLRGDDSRDYAEVCRQLRSVAAGLVELGVRPGERVAIYLNKRMEAVLSYFGSGDVAGFDLRFGS